jgi:hypothetical protein
MNHRFLDDDLPRSGLTTQHLSEEPQDHVTQGHKVRKGRIRDCKIIAAALVVSFSSGLRCIPTICFNELEIGHRGRQRLIIYYLRTHRFRRVPSDPTLDIQRYTLELLTVRKQIRLLKQAKYVSAPLSWPDGWLDRHLRASS